MLREFQEEIQRLRAQLAAQVEEEEEEEAAAALAAAAEEGEEITMAEAVGDLERARRSWRGSGAQQRRTRLRSSAAMRLSKRDCRRPHRRESRLSRRWRRF